MIPARRKLYSYAAVVAVYAIVFSWWLFFFAHQSSFLLHRLERQGIELPSEAAAALRQATDESFRMFSFEGGFLGILLLASMYLVVRSLQRELTFYRQQKNFLSAVTHELKSPLASAKLYVESLQLGRAEGEKRERYLRHAHEDLVRLAGLVDSLLETARMTQSGPVVALQPTDLGETARSVAAELREEAETRAAAVEVVAPASVLVSADPAALRTILRNLVANAVKYAGPDPRVRVEVARHGSRARMLVRDWGPGLQGNDPRRIFEPFVRGGDENVRTRPGVGLGLYLVAELARAQGGSARARTDLEGGGFGVEVSLPLIGEAA